MTIIEANFLGDFMCSEMNSTNTVTINMASNAARLPLVVLVEHSAARFHSLQSCSLIEEAGYYVVWLCICFRRFRREVPASYEKWLRNPRGRFVSSKFRELITQPQCATTQKTRFWHNMAVGTSNHCFHVVNITLSSSFVVFLMSHWLHMK